MTSSRYDGGGACGGSAIATYDDEERCRGCCEAVRGASGAADGMASCVVVGMRTDGVLGMGALSWSSRRRVAINEAVNIVHGRPSVIVVAVAVVTFAVAVKIIERGGEASKTHVVRLSRWLSLVWSYQALCEGKTIENRAREWKANAPNL
jgi:hypothetical protein